MTATLRQVWPLFAVRDVERSLAFYRDALGFELAGRAEDDGGTFWCRLARDGASIMLQRADRDDGPPETWGRGVAIYFVCDDANGLYEEFSGRGLALGKPVVADYGMKQIFVPDPDGYTICFESPTDAWAG
jgi:catechol 2,3-dioxygenase-like lactoylglutathione lyase family enzyme